jgi:outer membrane protein
LKKVLAVALLLAPAAAQAQLRLTLADAIAQALRNNTNAQLARTAEARTRIAQQEALSGLLPQADARVIRSNESINLATFGFTLPGFPPVVGPFNVYDGQLVAAMQLFNVAALRRFQATRAGAAAGRAALEQANEDVAAAVGRLYVLLERASAQAASRQADVTLFEQLAKVANDEFQAGTATRLDVAQANVQVARARQALLSAQNDRETARIALLSAMGVDQSQDVVIADELPAPPAPPAAGAALGTARERRPELRALAEQEKAARLTLDAARARYLPSVGLNFQGDIAGNHMSDLHSSRTISLVGSMPVFRGDIRADEQRAKLELEDIRARRSGTERDIEQQVRTAIMSLQNAAARVAVAGDNAKVAGEALQIARERRAAGYGSSVEVDRAEDAYRQAHEDLIAARADAAAAWIEVQHATGTIGDFVPQGDGGQARTPVPPPDGVERQASSPVAPEVP